MPIITEFSASNFDEQQKIAQEVLQQKQAEDADEYNNTEPLTNNTKNKSISLNYINFLGYKDEKAIDTQSLDRKVIKNKDSIKVKKSSPFLNRKNNEEVNVYQIHPPKVMEGLAPEQVTPTSTMLDKQLNKIYSSRGMYALDENTQKLIFYPPEFFNRDEMNRYRVERVESSQSRSSVGNDVGDVAL